MRAFMALNPRDLICVRALLMILRGMLRPNCGRIFPKEIEFGVRATPLQILSTSRSNHTSKLQALGRNVAERRKGRRRPLHLAGACWLLVGLVVDQWT